MEQQAVQRQALGVLRLSAAGLVAPAACSWLCAHLLGHSLAQAAASHGGELPRHAEDDKLPDAHDLNLHNGWLPAAQGSHAWHMH